MIQKINADNKERIETGALQINDDWTGLFIRGDDCMTLVDLLHSLDKEDADILDDIQWDWFIDKLTNIIESDVLR